jgi:hypothetical protein
VEEEGKGWDFEIADGKFNSRGAAKERRFNGFQISGDLCWWKKMGILEKGVVGEQSF